MSDIFDFRSKNLPLLHSSCKHDLHAPLTGTCTLLIEQKNCMQMTFSGSVPRIELIKRKTDICSTSDLLLPYIMT